MIKLILTSLSVVFAAGLSLAEENLLIQKGDKIAFMGDSITAAGNRKNGYVTFVIDALNKQGLKVSHVAAGKSGNKSPDMLNRLDRDVISKKPNWMCLSCGVNDVWHFTLKLGKRTFKGVPLEDYKRNITEILDKAADAGIKVVLLTSTMIGEDPQKDTNKKLEPYNVFLRDLAIKRKLPLADLNKRMQDEIKKIPNVKGKARMFGEPGYSRNIKLKLTSDGCHMNLLGNKMMAKGVLEAMGMSQKEIESASEHWGKKK